jgi:hypothetical protein
MKKSFIEELEDQFVRYESQHFKSSNQDKALVRHEIEDHFVELLVTLEKHPGKKECYDALEYLGENKLLSSKKSPLITQFFKKMNAALHRELRNLEHASAVGPPVGPSARQRRAPPSDDAAPLRNAKQRTATPQHFPAKSAPSALTQWKDLIQQLTNRYHAYVVVARVNVLFGVDEKKLQKKVDELNLHFKAFLEYLKPYGETFDPKHLRRARQYLANNELLSSKERDPFVLDFFQQMDSALCCQLEKPSPSQKALLELGSAVDKAVKSLNSTLEQSNPLTARIAKLRTIIKTPDEQGLPKSFAFAHLQSVEKTKESLMAQFDKIKGKADTQIWVNNLKKDLINIAKKLAIRQKTKEHYGMWATKKTDKVAHLELLKQNIDLHKSQVAAANKTEPRLKKRKLDESTGPTPSGKK